jgi:hypothetical protein
VIAAVALSPAEGRPLVAGDNSGQWAQWYKAAIPQAEQFYEDYMAEREKEMGR